MHDTVMKRQVRVSRTCVGLHTLYTLWDYTNKAAGARWLILNHAFPCLQAIEYTTCIAPMNDTWPCHTSPLVLVGVNL